jgi:hypothetical protein
MNGSSVAEDMIEQIMTDRGPRHEFYGRNQWHERPLLACQFRRRDTQEGGLDLAGPSRRPGVLH